MNQDEDITTGCGALAMQNPAQPFRNLAEWARGLEREPELENYRVELSIMSKKLDQAHEVFFSLGEMMTIWRSSGQLEKYPEFLRAFERAQLAYQTARGEPAPIMTPLAATGTGNAT